MELKEYIKKQINEHIRYCNSIKGRSSAYGTAFTHPKTKKSITWSEKCSLIEKDLNKRVNRIENKFNCQHTKKFKFTKVDLTKARKIVEGK